MPKRALVIGASRGLGQELVNHLSQDYKVYATVRNLPSPSSSNKASASVTFIDGVDLLEEKCAEVIVKGLPRGVEGAMDYVYITAGLLVPESFEELKWRAEIDMSVTFSSLLRIVNPKVIDRYTICAVAPVFIVQVVALFLALNGPQSSDGNPRTGPRQGRQAKRG